MIETNLLLTLIFVGFLFLILNLFISSITGFTWFFDWVSRIDINDSFINSFNFFWTTFLYLPSFFFLVLIITSISKTAPLTRLMFVYLFIFYLLYNIEISDFLILNLNLNVNNLNTTSLNLLLTNNLNKYHPFIFYLSVVFLLNLIYQNFNLWFSRFNFTKTYFSNYIYYNMNRITLVNLLALFLGSWWALQEGTWGGWWNWDPSEVLGLLFTFTGLLYIHSRINYLTTILSLYRLLYIIILITFSYIFIQLNFDLVSHNFGSKFFFFFNNNLFFLELTFLLVINYVFFLYYIQTVILNTILIRFITAVGYVIKYLNVVVWTLILYVLIFILIIVSFTPLVNYFLWIYFNINSLNFVLNINIIVICLVLGSLIPFISNYQLNMLILYPLLLLISPSLVYIIVLSLVITHNFSRWLHTSLILLFVSNILSYNIQFIYWYTFTEIFDIIIDSQLLSKNNEIHVCNNYFIDQVCVSNTSTQITFNTWNVFYSTNSLSLNNFNLLFNNNTFVNIYYLSSNWQNSALFIETNYLNNILELLFLVLIVVRLGTSNFKIYFSPIHY